MKHQVFLVIIIKKCLIILELNMTNPIPKLRYLINLLLTPGMDFKATNLEYDTHKFITKEDIEIYLNEKFLEAKHSKIIKQFDNGNVIVIFHWINNRWITRNNKKSKKTR